MTLLLGFAWLPVLPLATFALSRRLTGRADIALLAAAITVFGGGFDVGANRLWVNSLFLAGHQAWPLYPRDLVFGLLPLAVLAFIRALEDERGWRWAIVAGGLLGACALIQVQLLLPIPFALLAAAGVAALDRARRRAALTALVVTGGLTALLVAPWLLPTLGLIRRNGGVALDSADSLLPARIGFWEYPREFGLLLPLAVAGIGLVLIHLRHRDPELSGLRPRTVAGPLVLVPWFVVPWLLAVLYDPGWPLEDALRPQRLWLLSSQPGAILAAIGLVGVVRALVAVRWRRPRWTAPVVVAVLLVMAVPTTAFTVRLLAQTWREPVYAALDLARDRVPDLAALLGEHGPRATVLTYEDWSSLAWYETGSWVVAVDPPGYAKLAFDPAVFTGHAQDARRADLQRALRGDLPTLAAVADTYHATRIVLAQRPAGWGVIAQVAAVAAREPGATSGRTTIVEGNGWDAVDLAPGARLAFPITAGGPVRLELRVAAPAAGQAAADRRFRLLAVPTDQGVANVAGRPLADVVAPATAADGWQVVDAAIELRSGERLVVEAVDDITLQSFLGFTTSGPPDGWRVAATTAEAIVLERSP